MRLDALNATGFGLTAPPPTAPLFCPPLAHRHLLLTSPPIPFFPTDTPTISMYIPPPPPIQPTLLAPSIPAAPLPVVAPHLPPVRTAPQRAAAAAAAPIFLLQHQHDDEHPSSALQSDSDADHVQGLTTTAGGGGGGRRRSRMPSSRRILGSGEGGGIGSGADPQSRAEATKEKNRRAQQRFRHKQKSRMEALELEVVRLRAILVEKGIDPGSGASDDVSPGPNKGPGDKGKEGGGGGGSGGGGSVIPLIVAYPDAQQQQQQQTMDNMYAELEGWLEACTSLSRSIAVRYLQSWVSGMNDDARRLHYRSIQKRHGAGNMEEVALWVMTQVKGSTGNNNNVIISGVGVGGVGGVGGGMSRLEEQSPRGPSVHPHHHPIGEGGGDTMEAAHEDEDEDEREEDEDEENHNKVATITASMPPPPYHS